MTLDCVGLMGMLSQMTIKSHFEPEGYSERNVWMFCFVRIVWRFFGLSSGCVAFVMAIERYFALTKPFYYCKHFTKGLIKRLILSMWSSCAVLTFAPVFGFGIFCDVAARKCERYRDAEEPLDVAYAFIFFVIGKQPQISLPPLSVGSFIRRLLPVHRDGAVQLVGNADSLSLQSQHAAINAELSRERRPAN